MQAATFSAHLERSVHATSVWPLQAGGDEGKEGSEQQQDYDIDLEEMEGAQGQQDNETTKDGQGGAEQARSASELAPACHCLWERGQLC